ncbi:hypothetical protein BpHYR1_030770 [Brachionus plicatilis]|uniref:Uncharacterized protein n=1 Tax=Brachionus plicatilis TaxID=10195 RepID=A0A3M7SY22_BRAPC|nr:hypothetical protein BpHYR1_030770 [Brachionus plicatilis]
MHRISQNHHITSIDQYKNLQITRTRGGLKLSDPLKSWSHLSVYNEFSFKVRTIKIDLALEFPISESFCTLLIRSVQKRTYKLFRIFSSFRICIEKYMLRGKRKRRSKKLKNCLKIADFSAKFDSKNFFFPFYSHQTLFLPQKNNFPNFIFNFFTLRKNSIKKRKKKSLLISILKTFLSIIAWKPLNENAFIACVDKPFHMSTTLYAKNISPSTKNGIIIYTVFVSRTRAYNREDVSYYTNVYISIQKRLSSEIRDKCINSYLSFRIS